MTQWHIPRCLLNVRHWLLQLFFFGFVQWQMNMKWKSKHWQQCVTLAYEAVALLVPVQIPYSGIQRGYYLGRGIYTYCWKTPPTIILGERSVYSCWEQNILTTLLCLWETERSLLKETNLDCQWKTGCQPRRQVSKFSHVKIKTLIFEDSEKTRITFNDRIKS